MQRSSSGKREKGGRAALVSHPVPFLCFLLCALSGWGFQPEEAVWHLQILTVGDAQTLEAVVARLDQGEDFARLAKEYSTHPTGTNGGYLGEIRPQDLSEELKVQVEGMREGGQRHFFSPELGHTILRRLPPETARAQYARQALARGREDLESGRLEAAIRELKRALALEANLAEAHQYLGDAFRLLGSPPLLSEAKAELRQALSLDPSLVLARSSLAGIYLELGFPERARRVLEENPDLLLREPSLLSLLGETNRRSGDPESSLRQNREALAMDPQLPGARYYLALAYLDQDREEEAIEALDRALQLGLNRPDVRFLRLALAQERAGELAQAVDSYRKVLEFNPGQGHAHRQLAGLLLRQGRYQSALEHAQKSRQLGTPLRETLYRQILENLEGSAAPNP